MPLIGRLPVHHSIREFRAAAGQRYHEARRLVFGGDERHRLVATSGYALEMLLKAAYFRLRGRSDADPIAIGDLHGAKSYAQSTLGMIWPGNLHDVSAWAQLLIEERRFQHQPYPALFARRLNSRVRRVHANWRETLRYRSNRPYVGEVDAVLQCVRWVLGQYRFL